MTAVVGAHVRVPAGRLFQFFGTDGQVLSQPLVVHTSRTIALPGRSAEEVTRP